MRIISALTTCPRPNGVSYLQETLESLLSAGFSPQVIEDPELSGSYPALRRALEWLLERSGDALAVFQDDIQIAKGCRAWLENELWPFPEHRIGVVSLYTPTPCHLRNGWFSADEMPVGRTWGALALIFTRRFAEIVLTHKDRSMLTGSDTTIAGLCRQHGLAWMMHSPSLVEHIGAVSSIQTIGGRLDKNRTAGKWCRDVRELTHQRH